MLLNAPLEVFWCLTNRCNLNCIFCLTDAGPQLEGQELDEGAREFILRQLIKNRVLKVYLTGGEPLLCTQAISYIRELRGHNIFVELTTNGTLLGERTVQKLHKSGVNRVQVSLNGASAKANDSLMGKSFNRIVKGINWLRGYNISTHIKVTITQQNIADMLNIVKLLLGMGIKQMELCEVLPLGRGFENRSQLTPAELDLIVLREEITNLNRSNGNSVRFRSFSLTMQDNDCASACTVGHPRSQTCLIMADGEVIPCASAYVWGIKNNIMQKGLKRCWQDLEAYVQLLDPAQLKGKCGLCNLKTECQGGCRALAYQFTHDIWGEYPLCPYNGRTKHERAKTSEMAYTAH